MEAAITSECRTKGEIIVQDLDNPFHPLRGLLHWPILAQKLPALATGFRQVMSSNKRSAFTTDSESMKKTTPQIQERQQMP